MLLTEQLPPIGSEIIAVRGHTVIVGTVIETSRTLATVSLPCLDEDLSLAPTVDLWVRDAWDWQSHSSVFDDGDLSRLPPKQFDFADHHFRYHGFSADRPRQYEYMAVCACSNPDGDGVGAVEFYDSTISGVAEAWAEHLLEVAK